MDNSGIFISGFRSVNKPLLLFGILVMLVACGEDEFRVNATFATPPNLPADTPVYFEDRLIGKVVQSRSDDKRTVAIMLDQQVAQTLGQNSAVVVNAFKPGAPLEIYHRGSTEQPGLQNGQTIRGLDSMFHLSAWLVGDALLQGSGVVSKSIEAFQEYLESSEFERDQQAVKQQIDAAKESAQEVFKQLEDDLNKAAVEFRESETSASQATNEAVQQLTEELAPVLEELAQSGSEFAIQLEEFARGLEHSKPEQQQASLELLDRLIESLEGLKSRMEQDAEQSSEAEPAQKEG